MSRYIDAEQLWKYADNQKDKSISANDFMRFPTIDIVRCKECRSYNTEAYQDGYGYCDGHCSVVQDDDFCSYGEAREE